jgi:toxin YoeB
MNIKFSAKAFDDYNDWMIENGKTFRKVKSLIKEIQRTPFSGTGKPEPLKGNLSGSWSRRITDEHRLVYKIEDDTVFFEDCKGHYED